MEKPRVKPMGLHWVRVKPKVKHLGKARLKVTRLPTQREMH